jgi:CxxC motif-containing protein (DUF1111 family)
MNMPKLQHASISKYLLASTALMLSATMWSGSVQAQAQNQTQFSQFGGGGFGGGGGGFGGGGGRGGGGGGGGGSTTAKAVDPGVRGGAAGAGGPISGLTAAQQAFFTAAQASFEVIETGTSGLGPGFNELSCANCHVSPAIGGSSPTTNPQVTDANTDGATNVIPSFVTANGPIREARFVLNRDGTPDGNVHDLFSIQGRSDAPGCVFPQPNFAAELAQNNVIFRIPTPMFGAGFVEEVSDATLQSAFTAQASHNGSLGISGTFNHAGNTGNISRFGWKAQNASLLLFAGEAYNVEEGVTNDLFPNERGNVNDPGVTVPAACSPIALPEDTVPSTDGGQSASAASDFNSDIENFSMFARLLAPPTPAVPFTSSSTASTSTSTTSSTSSTSSSSTTSSTSTSAAPVEVASADPTSVLSAAAGTSNTSTSSSSSTTSAASIQAGFQAFQNIGCSGCHTVSLTTGNAAPIDTTAIASISNITINPFSDFAVHTMGAGLADRVTQGNANGMQFRSAPLWGVGQRVFFLHDGRTNNLVTAIEDHASSGSEANQVIQNFNMLSTTQQQNLLNFLRNL